MAARNNTTSGWVGWAYFASFMMMLLGALPGIAGLTGIFKDNYYVVTEKALLAFNFKTWGWINLVLGIVIFMAGLELLRGAAWARIIAVLLAIMSFVANMTFFNAYPWWSLVVMIVDVMVIYSLTVHGSELEE